MGNTKLQWLTPQDLFLAILFVVLAISGETFAASKAEVKITPNRNEEGVLEITCWDDDTSRKRLVVTCISIELSPAKPPSHTSNGPYLLGWYIDQNHAPKELWVGVELEPGTKEGKVSLALPAMLRSEKTLESTLLLTLRPSSSDLSSYLQSTTNALIIAPIQKITLAYKDTGLSLVDFAGWEKSGIDKLIWESQGDRPPVLEAQFNWKTELDILVEAVAAPATALLCAMALTGFVLLPKIIDNRKFWISIGGIVIILAVCLWQFRLLGKPLVIQTGFFGLGIVLGASLKKSVIDWLHRFKNPEPKA